MSIKAHRRKKASFKAFSFATYKGWSVFVAKGAVSSLMCTIVVFFLEGQAFYMNANNTYSE